MKNWCSQLEVLWLGGSDFGMAILHGLVINFESAGLIF